MNGSYLSILLFLSSIQDHLVQAVGRNNAVDLAAVAGKDKLGKTDHGQGRNQSSILWFSSQSTDHLAFSIAYIHHQWNGAYSINTTSQIRQFAGLCSFVFYIESQRFLGVSL